VLRGIMGFGANSRDIQTFKIEQLSSDMPMVVELVDTKENLERFLETINGHIKAGLVTLEKAQIRGYRGIGK
jgi:PII-like signaling protein